MLKRSLSRHDYRTLSLAALGGALEFYDFVIYVFLAPVIGRLFFPADMPDWLRLLQTFGIFSAGYLARPLGGILIAHFGDLLGRKRMFTLSIFLMAAPTLAIGLLPTYGSIGIAAPLLLLLMRILQGVAIGGEVPGAWVFVAEHVPEHRFGLGIGTLTAGLTTGILLGSLMAGAINSMYGADGVMRFAWRIPFVAGGVFGFVAVYLRRFLEETPVFREMAARRSLAREVPIKTVLREHRARDAARSRTHLGADRRHCRRHPVHARLSAAGVSCSGALRAAGEHRRDDHLHHRLSGVWMGERSDRHARGDARRLRRAPWQQLRVLLVAARRAGRLNLTYALTGFFVGAVTTVPIVAVRLFPAAVRFSGLSFSVQRVVRDLRRVDAGSAERLAANRLRWRRPTTSAASRCSSASLRRSVPRSV